MRCTVHSVTIEQTETTPRVVIRYEWDEAPGVITLDGWGAEVFLDHTGGSRRLLAEAREVVVG